MLVTYEQQELHQSGRKIRRDALAERVGYQDTGCVLSPSCLRCPLERCRYDQPGGVRKLRTTDRDETLRRFYAEGTPVDTLAARYDLSRRSVFRILAKGRFESPRLTVRGAARIVVTAITYEGGDDAQSTDRNRDLRGGHRYGRSHMGAAG